MRVSDLDTPAVLIDLDVMERNLCRVAEYTRAHGLRLRPHTKTHKIPELGRRQIAHGAAGLTVAKVGEAEVMVKAEPPELLVHYPIIGRHKLERLTAIAKKTQLTVALDNLFVARQLSDAAREAQVRVGVLAEVDVGLGRVGVAPKDVVPLAEGIRRLPYLSFEGVTFYPGHIKNVRGEGERELEAVAALVESMAADLERAGIEVKVISGGSTPALFESHRTGVTEIRPGTYIFNDRNTVVSEACGFEDCAVTVLATVVSTARPGQMIIDGGTKTFSSDRLVGSSEVSFGRVLEAPGAVFKNMNEEHGYVDTRAAGREFSVGDRVHVIPNHVCVVMNLHENVYGVRGDEVEQTWQVEGRGKLQ